MNRWAWDSCEFDASCCLARSGGICGPHPHPAEPRAFYGLSTHRRIWSEDYL